MTLAHFSGVGAQVLATVVRGGSKPPRRRFHDRRRVVVIGNEADGLDDADRSRCVTRTITIPMAGRSESLNAGVAASLIAFEALWQRGDAIAAPPTPSL